MDVFRCAGFPCQDKALHNLNQSENFICAKKSGKEGKQATYLLTQVEGLAAPDGADVDLRLGCSRLSILE